MQTVKTSAVKNSCNPQWNQELTVSVTDTNVPINLTVYDKDTFTADDMMGEAEIDIQPYVNSLKMGLKNLPTGCEITRVQPNTCNCLAEESYVVWDNGKIIQDMRIRLRNVESGEVDIQLEWIEVAGLKGLETDGGS
uniref:C2 domain-containing protein n=1 Tax=Rhizophora mucronata TaxID=61149 RepID=A0A2P2ITD5_RHIMU